MKHTLFLLSLAIILSNCQQQANLHTTFYNVYFNGDIITMETDTAQYAEALVEYDGKIVFVGSLLDAEKQFSPIHKIDLKGNTLLPGFIDPHSHFSNVSNAQGQLNLAPPPVGDVSNMAQLMDKLQKYKATNQVPDGEWIFATGYDDSELAEKRHPTSIEIDSVLPNNPVYLVHASEHMGVANSMALKKMQVDASSKNPPGGNIGRYPNSNQPNGLVQETAMYPFVGNMLQLLSRQSAIFFDTTQAYYAANGFTTAQDGMADRNKINFYQQIALHKKLKIDLIALAGFSELDKNLSDSMLKFKTYTNRFKVQGTKIIADGSPQGKTAFFTMPYLTPVPGCTHACKGLPSLDAHSLYNLFLKAYASNNQLFIHCNGDAAIDMVIQAHEKASRQLQQPLNKDRRTVIVHSQFVRPDQLELYVKYNLVPSFFTNHAYFWGDAHLQNVGLQRASFLSPIATANRLGLQYSNHSDATVTPLNPMLGIWSAVNRVSRQGVVIGENERATPYQALKAITIHAAYQYFDEAIKGSLKAGKLADLVILNKNPLKENPMQLKDIMVEETIKEGHTIYKRKKEKK